MRKLITTFSEIEDVFTLDTEIVKGEYCKTNDDYIVLENGELIKSCRDGRYIGDDEAQWEALLLQEFDDDDEPYQGELIGYVKTRI